MPIPKQLGPFGPPLSMLNTLNTLIPVISKLLYKLMQRSMALLF